MEKEMNNSNFNHWIPCERYACDKDQHKNKNADQLDKRRLLKN